MVTPTARIIAYFQLTKPDAHNTRVGTRHVFSCTPGRGPNIPPQSLVDIRSFTLVSHAVLSSSFTGSTAAVAVTGVESLQPKMQQAKSGNECANSSPARATAGSRRLLNRVLRWRHEVDYQNRSTIAWFRPHFLNSFDIAWCHKVPVDSDPVMLWYFACGFADCKQTCASLKVEAVDSSSTYRIDMINMHIKRGLLIRCWIFVSSHSKQLK